MAIQEFPPLAHGAQFATLCPVCRWGKRGGELEGRSREPGGREGGRAGGGRGRELDVTGGRAPFGGRLIPVRGELPARVLLAGHEIGLLLVSQDSMPGRCASVDRKGIAFGVAGFHAMPARSRCKQDRLGAEAQMLASTALASCYM